MKVLYLIDTLAVGGSEQSLLAILQRFQHTKPIVCHIYPGESLKPAFEAAGIPVISLNLRGRYAFRQAVGAVAKLLRTVKPDILHTTLFRADVVGRAAGRLTRTPVISSFVNEAYHPDRWKRVSPSVWLKLKVVQMLDRLTAGWACHFVAVSESTKLANCQALGIPPEKVSVIYRGRDADVFLTVSEKQVDTVRNGLNLPQDTPILLNVARILQRKGQEELVKAFPLILQAVPEARLLIAGDGPDRSRLENVVTELNLAHAVHLLGIRQDIPELLHLANTFVFPSHYEGHPGSLVEAMLTARPIVASDIPIHRECITHRETGLLAPTGEVESWAQNITWMLNHATEARRMGEQAQKVAIKRFQIDQIAAEHEQLYAEIAGNF